MSGSAHEQGRAAAFVRIQRHRGPILRLFRAGSARSLSRARSTSGRPFVLGYALDTHALAQARFCGC